MISEALSISVKLAMKSNVYKFDNLVRVQQDGGGMGVKLTGILSEFKMTKWCIKFFKRLSNLGIVNELLERYVDDMTICPTVIPKGWKYEDEKLIPDDNDISDNTSDDERTMLIIQSVANSVDDLIKVTYDIPSNYEDNKIPILDVKVGMNEDNKIEFEFFMKPIANKMLQIKNQQCLCIKKCIF